MNRLGFVLGLVLSFTASAQLVDENEDLTPAGVQIRQQFDALSLANASVGNVNAYLRSRPADIAAVRTYMDQVLGAFIAHARALLWILDMNGGVAVGQSRAFLSNSREDVLARGMSELGAVSYASAQATLATLTTNCPTCPGLGTAKTNLDKTVKYLTEFDRGLDYMEPRHPWNLGFPVATRDQSSLVAPHGDYRRFGEEMNSSLHITVDIYKKHFALAAAYPEVASLKKWNDTSLNLIDTMVKIIRAWQLAVGLESSGDKGDLDLMEVSDTTNRGRQFMRGMIALELLINTDHLPPWEGDVFGRESQIRGEPYQWDNACSHYVEIIHTDTTLSPMASSALDIIHGLCNGWAHTDNAAANWLHLRYNTSFAVVPEGH